MEQELGHDRAVWSGQAYCRAHPLVCVFPLLDVVIGPVQQSQFFLEQRLYGGKTVVALDACAKPRLVLVGHRQVGDHLAVAEQLPGLKLFHHAQLPALLAPR